MRNPERENEHGFLLVGLLVAIFIILLVMGVAAPMVARGLRREREVEAIHRGNQYVRAIQLYYKKLGHYPGSMEQLEKTNNIRFLRQRYADPMTGKPDWRLIKVGEAKTTVKGFFGQPLAGLTPGVGAAGTTASPGGIGGGTSGSPGSTGSSGLTFGSPSNGGSGSSMGGFSGTSGTSLGATSPGATSPGATSAGATDTSGAGGATGSTGGIGGQSATTFSGGGAPFVGVGSLKSGDSITVLNEQPSYQTWEFIYDPRIEQMKQQGSSSGGAGNPIGSPVGNPAGGSPFPTSPTSPSSPTTSPTSPSYPSPPSTTPQ